MQLKIKFNYKEVQKMKVYTHFGITDEKELYPGKIKSIFKITSAQNLPHANDGEDVLGLKMKECLTNKSFGYGLVDKKTQEEFKNDMKASKIEELVGKKVIGLIDEDKPFLQGIIFYEEKSNTNLRRNPNTK